MKLKKRFYCFLSLLTIAVCLFSVGITACAEGYRDMKSVFDAAEYETVVSAVAEDYSVGKNTVEIAYKLYDMTDAFAAAVEKGGTVESCISDNYAWMVKSGDGFYKTVYRDGGWVTIGKQILDEKNPDSSVIDADSAYELLKEIGESDGDCEIYLLNASMYFTNFAYRKVGDTEYLVPYSSRPDFTGLENGKVYTASEVAEKLNAEIKSENSSDLNAGGIIDGAETESSFKPVYIIVPIAVIAVIALAIFAVKKKKSI